MDSIIIFTAKYVFLGTVMLLAYAWLASPKKQRMEMVFVTILAGLIALLVSRLASALYYDPRPFVSGQVRALIPHASDNGFPSDHALLTMTLTAALYFYRKKLALTALALSVMVGAARVLAHIHSPIDILGAWAIGVIAAAVAYYGVRQLPWFKPPPDK